MFGFFSLGDLVEEDSHVTGILPLNWEQLQSTTNNLAITYTVDSLVTGVLPVAFEKMQQVSTSLNIAYVVNATVLGNIPVDWIKLSVVNGTIPIKWEYTGKHICIPDCITPVSNISVI